MKNKGFLTVLFCMSFAVLCTACGGGGGGGGGGAPAANNDADTSGTGGTGAGGSSGGSTGSTKKLSATVADSKVFIKDRTIEIPSTLWVCEHEVTQKEYKTYCTYGGLSPSDSRGKGDNYPAYYVSWYDALVYCNKRSMAEKLTPCYTINGSTDPKDWGTVPTSNDTDWDDAVCDFTANGYRLPTEAEWEYAARGGNLTTGGQTTYAGSDDIDAVAWYGSNSGSKAHEVKGKEKNGLDLYDMSGNVWEWCWDWYGSIDASTPSDGPAAGASSCFYRVMRGGWWSDTAGLCAVSYRRSNLPYLCYSGFGCRVVRSAQ